MTLSDQGDMRGFTENYSKCGISHPAVRPPSLALFSFVFVRLQMCCLRTQFGGLIVTKERQKELCFMKYST